MQKIGKKMLALLLAVLLLASAAPLTVGADGGYSVGDIIEYGTYPQSRVEDEETLTALNALSLNWHSYCYINGTLGSINGTFNAIYQGQMYRDDYMRYADVEYPIGSGIKYRAVTFDTYRPTDIAVRSSLTCSSIQKNNGYKCETIYWFKFEPLQWFILDPATGYVLCKSVIDAQPFNDYAYAFYSTEDKYTYVYGDSSFTYYCNNYEKSSLRRWLNTEFYNWAFSENGKDNICEHFYDNDTTVERYKSAPVQDNISLLSYAEAINDSFGIGSKILTYSSDYSRVQGYNASWTLRTPKQNDYTLYAVNGNNKSFFDWTFHTANGIRPVMYLKELRDDYTGSLIIEHEPDGMRIVANNTDLTYPLNSKIVFAVSNLENGVESKIDKLSVKSSDSSVVKFSSLIDYEDFERFAPILPITKYDEFKKCKFVVFDAIDEGAVYISLTNSETGETRYVPLNITVDQMAIFRADAVAATKRPYDNDYYNTSIADIYVADFDYKSTSDGYLYTMNIYNHNHCPGVVEVHDASGKLINVKEIDKYEMPSKGIIKTIKTDCILILEGFRGETFSFRSEVTSKETKIKDLFVPKGGYVIITCDSIFSPACLINNIMDAVFTTFSVTGNVGKIISGKSDISKNDLSKLKSTVFARLLLQEEYIKFAEKIQKDFWKKFSKNLTNIDLLKFFLNSGMIDIEEFLSDTNLTLDGLFKTALGSGVSLAEEYFEDSTGVLGKIIKVELLGLDIIDLFIQLRDFEACSTGHLVDWIYTPINGSNGVLNNADVSIKLNGNVPKETVLESYRILYGNENYINLESGEVYSEYEEYEIALVKDGQYIQPNGAVDVYIASPYEKAIVARQKDDGSWEIIQNKLDNGLLSFSVDHFCRFALIEDKTDYVALSSIAVKTIPTKTTYTIGESFNQTGLTLTATYSDGSTQTVTSGFICTGFSSATAGTKTITVTYEGKTATFTVTVNKVPDPIIKIRNYAANKTVDYRTTITFSAEVTNAVSGGAVHWFIDGQDRGTSDTYTYKEAKKNFTVQAKYMKGSTVLAESEVETVKVNAGFFARLKAFFRALFGRLPKVVQEYLGVEIIDRVLP